ncbi:unnamed protein product [Diabrotica balteata]|uniref:RNA polymerase II subunit A C-terminal domain phosphatase n=1 Tax=Diabrotica balteata TaxID=107213 RepID=A0A9N9TCV2_DIABA|nr:unnamed protein product [Diabrotica balteata]
MAERTISIFQQQTKPIKICKWKIRTGTRISIGCPILIYDFEEAIKPEQRKLKSTQAGTVHQILVREEQIVKPGALFPCGDNMVCIIDDREDVWSHATNLIHVKPYHFFQHTGDINAPPGLDKHENDKLVKGIDLTKVSTKKNNTKVTSEENDNGSRDVETNPEDKEDKTVTDNGNSEEDKKSKVEENANQDELENSQCETENQETVDGENKKQEADKQPVNNKDDEKDVENKNNENVADENMNENSEITKTKPEEPKNNETESNSENKISDKENKKDKSDKPEELIDIDDPDDYLIYLEEILKHIHQEFYKQYDELEAGEVPDLKQVIPTVRSNILEGCRLVFSGLVPTHINLEQSKAYLVARGLGAVVTQDIEDTTTHLVAVRPGTAKVNSGRRKKKLKIVTPDWLWCCAERWEHVDERIFPLNSKGSKNRHPPPHCSSPEHITSYPEHGMPDTRKRTPSGKFMDTINPLMSFSSDDIADMDKEVEDILEDDDSESSEEDIKQDFGEKLMSDILSKTSNESSSSSEDSLTGEYPRGYKRKKFEPNVDDLYNSTEDESPSVKFRRGENVHDMLDYEQDDTQDSTEPIGDVDDGEWNMMGAALEREFLSNN